MASPCRISRHTHSSAYTYMHGHTNAHMHFTDIHVDMLCVWARAAWVHTQRTNTFLTDSSANDVFSFFSSSVLLMSAFCNRLQASQQQRPLRAGGHRGLQGPVAAQENVGHFNGASTMTCIHTVINGNFWQISLFDLYYCLRGENGFTQRSFGRMYNVFLAEMY